MTKLFKNENLKNYNFIEIIWVNLSILLIQTILCPNAKEIYQKVINQKKIYLNLQLIKILYKYLKLIMQRRLLVSIQFIQGYYFLMKFIKYHFKYEN